MERCIARTEIPRTVASLSVLRNVCVKFEGQVVAWCFLGADGSLSSLHVEEEYRGKGLARGVVGELMRRGMVEGGEGMREGWGWVTSDVYWDNEAGKGVARALGLSMGGL